MEEKECPICSLKIFSDATTREFCKLCGMAIVNPKYSPQYRKKGIINYFCCYRCLSIYVCTFVPVEEYIPYAKNDF